MQQPESKNDDDLGRPISELSDTGLLWLINATVFHPRGYMLSLHFNEDGVVTGWSLTGTGDTVFTFADDAAERKFQTCQELFGSLSGE